MTQLAIVFPIGRGISPSLPHPRPIFFRKYQSTGLVQQCAGPVSFSAPEFMKYMISPYRRTAWRALLLI
jgi:hypothetical protein